MIIELRVRCKSQEISRDIRMRLANVGKLLFVRSMSVDVRDSMSETQCPRPNVRDSISETQCQRLNVRDPMSETQCQRLNVKVGFTNLVTRLCYISHLGVQFDIGVRRDSGFVVFSFPSLDCCKAFSEGRMATHSIYVLGRHL
jgi:hypothetical protein